MTYTLLNFFRDNRAMLVLQEYHSSFSMRGPHRFMTRMLFHQQFLHASYNNSFFLKTNNKMITQGHLEISVSASWHHHHHWNQDWHRHCKNFIFVFRSFFEKIKHFCSFLCSVIASALLCYKYLFLYNFLKCSLVF